MPIQAASKSSAGTLQGNSESLLGNITTTGGSIIFDQRVDGTYAAQHHRHR